MATNGAVRVLNERKEALLSGHNSISTQEEILTRTEESLAVMRTRLHDDKVELLEIQKALELLKAGS